MEVLPVAAYPYSSNGDKESRSSQTLGAPGKVRHSGMKNGTPWQRSVYITRYAHPATCFMVSVIIALIGMVIGVFYGYQGEVYKPRFSLSGTGNGLGLEIDGQVTAIDAEKGIFSISWFPSFGCGSPDLYSNFTGNSTLVCGFPNVDLNFYTQENASSSFNATWTAGQYAAASANFFQDPHSSTNPIPAATQSFETDIPFGLLQQLEQDKYATDLSYPFDKYKAYITFLTSRAATNETVLMVAVDAQSSVPNWSISSEGFPMTKCTSVGLDDNFNGVCLATELDPLQRYVVVLTASRSGSTIAFVSMIWLTNWLISLVIVWMTAKIVIFRNEIPSDLLLVPITALFSLPAVRGTMPDAPNFGSYMDVCGFLFNLTLISLCSALVLVVGIRRHFGKD